MTLLTPKTAYWAEEGLDFDELWQERLQHLESLVPLLSKPQPLEGPDFRHDSQEAMADAATTEMLRKMIGMPIPGLSRNKTEQTEPEQLNTELYEYLQQLEQTADDTTHRAFRDCSD